jgi:hypothetical protein
MLHSCFPILAFAFILNESLLATFRSLAWPSRKTDNHCMSEIWRWRNFMHKRNFMHSCNMDYMLRSPFSHGSAINYVISVVDALWIVATHKDFMDTFGSDTIAYFYGYIVPAWGTAPVHTILLPPTSKSRHVMKSTRQSWLSWPSWPSWPNSHSLLLEI